ncbi:MAG: hypothetical protein IJ272_09150 [Clostridia bacterium]|nr:hypothetical protein [Clostridia bacterium]
MKLTDFALIFVAVFLPVVVIVFVNTSFVVKSEKQEMYYKNLMNSAITDAVSSMKHIENEDEEIDYGYSGIVDKKVSINANTAITTFYNSLANNFNVANNEVSLERLKMYIPVIAILDYDGIYIHSAEEDESGNITFVTKPKVYYTYSYVITKEDNLLAEDTYEILSLSEIEDISTYKENNRLLSDYIYEINFTMDDYVYLNIYKIADKEADEENYSRVEYSKNFYLTDNENNSELVYSYDITQSKKNKIKKQVVEKLDEIKSQVIGEIGMKEISYAVNRHNIYAKQAGINYTFRFSVESDATWYETMDGIGMIAIIQGVSLGNRYLNYKAYSASDLIITRKYYVSKGVTGRDDIAYLSKDLYHASNRCDVYLEYINSTREKIIPSYYTKKADAATQGFYPCPICKP